MATKREKQGTVHELDSILANIEEADKYKPHTKIQINKYIKLFDKYKLFPAKADRKKKEKIIKQIKSLNISEADIKSNQVILKSVLNYNRLIDRERRKVENEIRSGKNVKENDRILKGQEKKEIKIPEKIRNDLKLRDKFVRLIKYNTEPIRNKIKLASGQDYDFVIKNGFGRPIIVPYKKLQEIRKKGNVVEFLLQQFEKDIKEVYERDKRKYSKSEPKKWKSKKKVYEKILKEVIDHNLQIATNKRYNEPFVKRDKKGHITKKDSRIPILMDIFDEVIYLYIP